MKRLRNVKHGLGLRFAVVGGIYGNEAALRAVMTDLRQQGVSFVVNLGDCLSGPLQPAKTADILMRADFLTVSGEHDRALAEAGGAPLQPWDRMAAEQITARHRAWLKELPKTYTMWQRVFVCHAAPNDDTMPLLDVVTPDGRPLLAAHDHIERLARGVKERMILTGHSHTPRVYYLEDGRLVVNPGSVGCPGSESGAADAALIAAGHARASYAILEEDNYDWDVAFRLVIYDTTTAARQAAIKGSPDWADALGRQLGRHKQMGHVAPRPAL